jgi:hypothetical protein
LAAVTGRRFSNTQTSPSPVRYGQAQRHIKIMTMSNEIISSVLGQLTQDKNLKEWWKSVSFEIPFFNNEKLTITFADCEPGEDKTFIQEADQALTNFFKINSSDRHAISELAYKLCMDFLNEIEFDEADDQFRQISDKNEI